MTQPSSARTQAQRKADERQRRTEAGLKRVPDIWAHPEDHAGIKERAAELAARRKPSAAPDPAACPRSPPRRR